ncbi:MAG: hypothetical protein QOI86_2749 [Actinomycetota bacterium]|nr:hypothetical protein [Actinomycetota bacterium]
MTSHFVNAAAAIVAALGIEPEWSVAGPEGWGFVAGELGTWLAVHRPEDGPAWLHVEVRLARDVPDGPATWAFLDDRNNKALVGRWIHDPSTGAVALAADLPLAAVDGAGLPYAVEVVAGMVNTAETLALLSAPQRDLGGAKALTLVGGRRRPSWHAVCEHLPRRVYPAGRRDRVPSEVLTLVQDSFLSILPGWLADHDALETMAEAEDGSLLVVRAARHPHAGWGLMVVLGGERYGCDPDDGALYAAALNRRESALAVGPVGAAGPPAAGCWTHYGAGLEYRLFLPAALLAAVDDLFAPVAFVGACVRDVAARADATLTDRDPPPAAVPILERAAWPGDDEAATAARRDPINDGLDIPEASIYLDMLGRACAITDASFALWRSRLVPGDHDEVAGFIRFCESCIADRARRSGANRD